jgi:hypothetical protein
VLVAQSGAKHSERILIEMAGERRILDLYSEYQPCSGRCDRVLKDVGVSWSWDRNAVDPLLQKVLRKQSDLAKTKAVRELFVAGILDR